MQIIVNHLTRMQPGYICVAGIDVKTGKHVRPMPRSGNRLGTRRLARNGGAFDMACVVELGPATPNGKPPEMEDHLFYSSRATRLRSVAPEEFWNMLEKLAQPTFASIFGKDLARVGWQSCGVGFGKGEASLGCLRATGPVLCLKERPDRPPSIRLHLHDGEFDVDLPVTDIRLYGADHVTPDRDAVARTAQRLAGGMEVILSVGLSRPYASQPGVLPLHWLQVNNIHLRDNPCWQLG